LMSFFVAWDLLTSIPLGRGLTTVRQPGRAGAWFPWVGLVIGAMLSLLDLLLRYVLPPLPAAALLLVAWVGVSGALHLDGFVDCCDGLLVAQSAERRLEILKDSRVGAFGVVGATCLLLVKFAALTALPSGERMRWLLLAPVLSRWVMVWAAWHYPLARPDGFAVWFREGLSGRRVAVAAGSTLLLGLALGGWRGLLSLALVWLFALAFIAWTLRRIPGLTGDVYGALNELSEVFALLWAIAMWGGA
jgi:adenosylcobinamide-GDP ribazoletransferase